MSGSIFTKLAKRSPPRRQNGMALIIVLWLIVLLGVIATGHAANVHSETTLAMRHIQSAKARTLAEAGIQRAIVALLLQNSAAEWPVNGMPQKIVIDDRELSVAIRDASGLVDLNAADAGLLGALLANAGGGPLQQEQLVDAILDWRDADDLRHLHGAEDEDYRAAGLAWTARDAAFSSVEELRYVLGMTPEIFSAIAPYLTVHSAQSGLNMEYAAPGLISMLSGQTIETASREREVRIDSHSRRRGRVNTHNRTFHIYASATANADVSASVEAVVNISAAADRPYSILYWREPARFQFPAEE